MTTVTATRQALLAARLEAVMRRRGLSVRQLALRAGVALSVVQKLIAGDGRQTSIWTVVQLADTLTISLDYLAGRTTRDVAVEPPGPQIREPDREPTGTPPKRTRRAKATSGG
ncbi:MAG TPA: helix-turn-helix transcriptional regulator [Candidatus Tectomicrobia bacterium]